jgi:hypothetical protein
MGLFQTINSFLRERGVHPPPVLTLCVRPKKSSLPTSRVLQPDSQDSQDYYPLSPCYGETS